MRKLLIKWLGGVCNEDMNVAISTRVKEEVAHYVDHKENVNDRIITALGFVVDEEFDKKWEGLDQSVKWKESTSKHREQMREIIEDAIADKIDPAIEKHMKSPDWLAGVVQRILSNQLFEGGKRS